MKITLFKDYLGTVKRLICDFYSWRNVPVQLR